MVLIHGGFWRPRYDRGHLASLAQHGADVGHYELIEPDSGVFGTLEKSIEECSSSESDRNP